MQAGSLVSEILNKYSYENMEVYCGDFRSADLAYERLCKEICDDKKKIKVADKYMVEEVEYLMDLVKSMDWSMWYDIYKDDDKKCREYFGVVVDDGKSQTSHAVILYKGDFDGCSFPCKLTCTGIDIHSHPSRMINYNNRLNLPILPSHADFQMHTSKLSLLVSISGIIIYGIYPGYNADKLQSRDDALDAIINGDVICKFVSWVDLGYSKHSYMYDHDHDCDVSYFESMYDGCVVFDFDNTSIIKTCTCKPEIMFVNNDELIRDYICVFDKKGLLDSIQYNVNDQIYDNDNIAIYESEDDSEDSSEDYYFDEYDDSESCEFSSSS